MLLFLATLFMLLSTFYTLYAVGFSLWIVWMFYEEDYDYMFSLRVVLQNLLCIALIIIEVQCIWVNHLATAIVCGVISVVINKVGLDYVWMNFPYRT